MWVPLLTDICWCLLQSSLSQSCLGFCVYFIPNIQSILSRKDQFLYGCGMGFTRTVSWPRCLLNVKADLVLVSCWEILSAHEPQDCMLASVANGPLQSSSPPNAPAESQTIPRIHTVKYFWKSTGPVSYPRQDQFRWDCLWSISKERIFEVISPTPHCNLLTHTHGRAILDQVLPINSETHRSLQSWDCWDFTQWTHRNGIWGLTTFRFCVHEGDKETYTVLTSLEGKQGALFHSSLPCCVCTTWAASC